MLACWLLIAGWWYLRNLTLYGELLGTATMLDNFGRRHATPWQLFTEEFQGLRISYWAIFGAFSILAHDLFYHAMDLLTLLGVGGLAVFVAKQFQSSGSGNDRSDSPAGETAQDFFTTEAQRAQRYIEEVRQVRSTLDAWRTAFTSHDDRHRPPSDYAGFRRAHADVVEHPNLGEHRAAGLPLHHISQLAHGAGLSVAADSAAAGRLAPARVQPARALPLHHPQL